ncbi:MAG: sodium:solute symporter family protein [Calditrichaeota bacterium]|nr:sodium:solute symporter family protein [Calditrichota bacterium]
METRTLYWIAFVAYSLLVLGIGYHTWRRHRHRGSAVSNQTYWAADRQLSGWSVGLSISASMMSISWSCVYGVQLFYWYGVGAIWLLIIPWLLTMAGFYLLSPRFRRMAVFSQPELLEKRFGIRSRQLLSPALILVFTVWGGAEIYAAGITLQPFLGLPLPWTLLIIACIVAAYSFLGGFGAVVSTDKIQFLLVAGFISLMAFLGFKGLQTHDQVLDVVQLTRLAPKSQSGIPWLFSPGPALILITLFVYLPGWLVETDVWIRLQAARSNPEARKGIFLAAVNSLIFVGIVPMIIGLSALAIYPAINGEIPARLQDGAFIFGAFMQDFSSSWLNLILGIGLLAASMSTVDTCGNVVALSASYDLLEPRLKHRWSPHRLNLLSRWMSAGAIFLAFFYALFTESLWDIFYLSSGILTTTVFLPVVAAFHPGTHSRMIHGAILFGFAGTLIFYFLESRGHLSVIEPQWLSQTGLGYIIWGFLASILGFLMGSRIPPHPGNLATEKDTVHHSSKGRNRS